MKNRTGDNELLATCVDSKDDAAGMWRSLSIQRHVNTQPSYWLPENGFREKRTDRSISLNDFETARECDPSMLTWRFVDLSQGSLNEMEHAGTATALSWEQGIGFVKSLIGHPLGRWSEIEGKKGRWKFFWEPRLAGMTSALSSAKEESIHGGITR